MCEPQNDGHLRENDAVVMVAWKLDAGGSEMMIRLLNFLAIVLHPSFFPRSFDRYLKHFHEQRIKSWFGKATGR